MIYSLIRTYGAKSCLACPAGQYSLKDMQSCLPCPMNTYSINGSATCTTCKNGTYSNSR